MRSAADPCAANSPRAGATFRHGPGSAASPSRRRRAIQKRTARPSLLQPRAGPKRRPTGREASPTERPRRLARRASPLDATRHSRPSRTRQWLLPSMLPFALGWPLGGLRGRPSLTTRPGRKRPTAEGGMQLIIEDDEGRKTVVPLVRDEITIGRDDGNVIDLTERNVSRRHARLKRDDGQLLIEDSGSYNGVLINGDRIAEPTPVKEGDLIEIGDD